MYFMDLNVQCITNRAVYHYHKFNFSPLRVEFEISAKITNAHIKYLYQIEFVKNARFWMNSKRKDNILTCSHFQHGLNYFF